MRPVRREELLDLVAYEKQREPYLAKTIEYKRTRRVPVGGRLTFIFENRETVRFQIQEMLRAERTVKEEKIEDELAVYNELIPGENELSATLMIEITDVREIRPELDRLIGIDEHVFLDVGDRSVQATFDPKQFEEERISAVQYVRFPLGPELACRFCDPKVAARLRVEHPSYREATPLDGAVRASLATDLTSE